MVIYRLLGDISQSTIDIYKDIIMDEDTCFPFSQIGFDKKGFFTNCPVIANLHEQNICFSIEIEEKTILYILNIDFPLFDLEQIFEKYREDSNQMDAEIFAYSFKLNESSIVTNNELLALFVNGDTKTKKVLVNSVY